MTAARAPPADFSLLDSAPDAMIVADERGRILFVNGLAEELFGWSRGELVGHLLEMLVPARYRAAHPLHRSGYQASPRARPMGPGAELTALRKDGQEFAAEISLSPLSTAGGRYVIAAVRDVSERKKLEERARLYRRAQDEVRERDEFLAVAAHELRTPVTALQLQLELLQRAARQASGELPTALAARLVALERQARRIGVLVNELLDVSRLRREELELRVEELDLAALARRAVGRLVEQSRGTASVAVLADAPVIGRWDGARLEELLAYLLSNAIKFGQSKSVEVRVAGDADQALVEVRDHGIGIALADQERVFRRFERAVTSQHFGGLGLGLYLARQIVEAHGGAIDLASTPGTGTTVTVRLPRAPSAPRPSGTAREAQEVRH